MDTESALVDPAQILKPEDVFIAVMGLTGVGKSTFVTLCTQKQIQIGHQLESCTSSVSIFSFQHKSKTVHLIDSAGFNDTTRSESEVLQEVAYWLSTAYGKADAKLEDRFRLDGIVYLHSIADVRWSGSTRRSLNMLRTICGPENYGAIVLTTTFWDQVDRETGQFREAQLIGDMNKWGQLVHASPKSSVRRHDQGYKTAISIIEGIIDRGVKYELLIQKELAKPGATLHDTTAGREAQLLWEKDIERFQQELGYTKKEMNESQQQSDATFVAEVAKLKSSISQGRAALGELHLPKKELENRWMSRNAHDVELLQRQIVKCQNTIEDLIKRSAGTSSPSLPDSPPAYSRRTSDESAASSASSLLQQERRWKKELMAQQMAKLAARSMHINVASALFGGVLLRPKITSFGGIGLEKRIEDPVRRRKYLPIYPSPAHAESNYITLYLAGYEQLQKSSWVNTVDELAADWRILRPFKVSWRKSVHLMEESRKALLQYIVDRNFGSNPPATPLRMSGSQNQPLLVPAAQSYLTSFTPHLPGSFPQLTNIQQDSRVLYLARHYSHRVHERQSLLPTTTRTTTMRTPSTTPAQEPGGRFRAFLIILALLLLTSGLYWYSDQPGILS
ncbi:hypothetical protein PV04_04307 [Phialophora macrospora]|uniref:G domain-containing protein n=1 Tax=Phialophora macrospora TaxID=1851006 RepID=A0A0D2G8W6_9EURO|nr:hypothetical protein PV04_04307 [Phialophora macrospora]